MWMRSKKKRRTRDGEGRVWEVCGPLLERLRRPSEAVGEECAVLAFVEVTTRGAYWPQ